MALTQISTQGIKDGTITGTDLATNIDLVDNQKLRLGTGNDLEIYYSGTHAIIDNVNGGDFLIRQLGSSGNIHFDPKGGQAGVIIKRDDAVELYYNGSKKFETKSDGIDVTGEVQCDSLDVDGVAHFQGGDIDIVGANYNAVWDYSESRLKFNDNAKLVLGSGIDLQIYHDGTVSRIQDVGTGGLEITSDGTGVDINKGLSEYMARFITDGAVELYHNNLIRFQTTSNGCQLQSNTTDAVFSLRSTAQDGAPVLQFLSDDFDDTSDAWRLRADGGGTAFSIQNKASGSWENSIVANENGNVKLYYDNSVKLETTSAGATVTGALTATGFATNGGGVTLNGANYNAAWVRSADTMRFNDNAKAGFGNADDLQIYHDGSHSYIQDSGTGDLTLIASKTVIGSSNNAEVCASFTENGAVELYHDNSKKFETTSGGVNVTGAITVNGAAIGGGGKVIQVLQTTSNLSSTSSGSFQDVGLSQAITMTNSANKILVIASGGLNNSGAGNGGGVTIFRGTTNLAHNNDIMAGYFGEDNSNNIEYNATFHKLDTPGAGTHTYAVKLKAFSGTQRFAYRNTGYLTVIELDFS